MPDYACVAAGAGGRCRRAERLRIRRHFDGSAAVGTVSGCRVKRRSHSRSKPRARPVCPVMPEEQNRKCSPVHGTGATSARALPQVRIPVGQPNCSRTVRVFHYNALDGSISRRRLRLAGTGRAGVRLTSTLSRSFAGNGSVRIPDRSSLCVRGGIVPHATTTDGPIRRIAMVTRRQFALSVVGLAACATSRAGRSNPLRGRQAGSLFPAAMSFGGRTAKDHELRFSQCTADRRVRTRNRPK